jgi:hypothetical protein
MTNNFLFLFHLKLYTYKNSIIATVKCTFSDVEFLNSSFYNSKSFNDYYLNTIIIFEFIVKKWIIITNKITYYFIKFIINNTCIFLLILSLQNFLFELINNCK